MAKFLQLFQFFKRQPLLQLDVWIDFLANELGKLLCERKLLVDVIGEGDLHLFEFSLLQGKLIRFDSLLESLAKLCNGFINFSLLAALQVLDSFPYDLA